MATLVFAIAIAATTLEPAWTAQKDSAPQSVDLLIAGGTVVDGSGKKPRVADVGIRGDRIAFIGNAGKAKVQAARVIEAKGLVVAPGFVDPHAHVLGELSDPERNSGLNYLMQGVTTVIVGNDGGGPSNVAQTVQRLEQQGIGINAGVLVGHGTVRREVLGPGDVQPTLEQLAQMKDRVRQAMQEGALGLSSGLFYVPGSFSKTEEVIELARVAGEMGGVYDTHMRDESSYSVGLLAAIEEAIRIGREAKIPVNISHIKCLGPEVWGQSAAAIKLIKKARKEGVRVTADQYPYTASGSGLTASLLPRWAQAGPREDVLALLTDPAQRPRLVEEMERNLKRRNGADALLFRSSQAPELQGRTLAAVAKERGKPPVETAIEIIIEYLKKNAGGALSVVSFNMNEKDVERFMKQEFVTTGSDGSAGHPRLYGTFPKKLREYVYTKKTISLPFFVQHSSAMTAETFHLKERGALREGYFADVVVFDPATIADRATFEKPNVLATGVKYVLVNGTLAVEDGGYTNARAGRALRRQAAGG
jgi:N-acyl-D-aspartate/D-glutamate deacylase